jgi:hypothetical protein
VYILLCCKNRICVDYSFKSWKIKYRQNERQAYCVVMYVTMFTLFFAVDVGCMLCIIQWNENEKSLYHMCSV